MRAGWLRRHGFICALGLLVLFVLLSFAHRHVSAQELTPAEFERHILGMWELAEWHVEGEVLTPPVVNGRIVFQDGHMVAIRHINNGGTAYDISSYGSYSFNQAVWGYAYERQLEVTTETGESTVTRGTRAQNAFTYRREGPNVILDNQGRGGRWIWGPDEFSIMQNGQVLRTWRRLQRRQ